MKSIQQISLLVLFSFFTAAAIAGDSVTIKGIPHRLFWENKPAGFKQWPGKFLIESGAKTDMFRDPNVTYNTDNAPKLLFYPDKDFVLVTAIQHPFNSKWDGGALVLIADSLNWIKFCFEKDYKGARRVVTVATKDISDDCNSIAAKSNKIFYKIAKAGNVITLYCAEDGKDWLLVRHLQLNSDQPLRVGFLAQSPLGENCKVTFSDFHYVAKTIKDPYTGE